MLYIVVIFTLTVCIFYASSLLLISYTWNIWEQLYKKHGLISIVIIYKVFQFQFLFDNTYTWKQGHIENGIHMYRIRKISNSKASKYPNLSFCASQFNSNYIELFYRSIYVLTRRKFLELLNIQLIYRIFPNTVISILRITAVILYDIYINNWADSLRMFLCILYFLLYNEL